MSLVKFQCNHNIGCRLLIEVDGTQITSNYHKTYTTTEFELGRGSHKLYVIKKTSLLHWYWWLNIFNLIHVLMRLKNVTDGSLGYDDNFASCTVDFVIDNNEYQVIMIDLISKYYNKNGKQGNYLVWDNLKSENIKVDLKVNSMDKYLIKRWFISKGFPAFFYCILTSFIMIYKYLCGELKMDIELIISMVLFWLYSIYLIIKSYRTRSVIENIKNNLH